MLRKGSDKTTVAGDDKRGTNERERKTLIKREMLQKQSKYQKYKTQKWLQENNAANSLNPIEVLQATRGSWTRDPDREN